jgi:transposase
MFEARNEEFLVHYHQRSNAESTFSMVKRKFGSSVRAKLFPAQANEILLKCLCHKSWASLPRSGRAWSSTSHAAP